MAKSTRWKCLILQCIKNGAFHALNDFDSSFGVSFNNLSVAFHNTF